MSQVVFLVALTLIVFYFIFMYRRNGEEGFCSSCMANVFGPIHYTYKYGDPFHTYLHQERQRFSRLTPVGGARGSWMNPSEQEKKDDKRKLESKINRWYHEFGQPGPLFAHSVAQAACRKSDCKTPDSGCMMNKLINDVGRYRYWEPAYAK